MTYSKFPKSVQNYDKSEQQVIKAKNRHRAMLYTITKAVIFTIT